MSLVCETSQQPPFIPARGQYPDRGPLSLTKATGKGMITKREVRLAIFVYINGILNQGE